MENKNITNKILLDGYEGVQADGNAVSMVEGIKYTWCFLIPEDLSDLAKYNLSCHMAYAQLAASYEEEDRPVPLMNILVNREESTIEGDQNTQNQFLTPADSWDVWHPAVNKISLHFLEGAGK